MYYVYTLKSLVDGRLYIGYSSDLRKRFRQHNAKKVKSTKYFAPWKLIYYQAFLSKKDALKEEKRLKMHAAKNNLKSVIKYSLEMA